jgi:RES domain-containing protein
MLSRGCAPRSRDGVVGELAIEESELERRRYAEIEAAAPLRLVDLRENGAVAMGVPTDVHRGTAHALGRAWSVAFHDHPQNPDGIIYPSRLNGEVNLAVYGRAVSKLRPIRLRRLIDIAELAPVLSRPAGGADHVRSARLMALASSHAFATRVLHMVDYVPRRHLARN